MCPLPPLHPLDFQPFPTCTKSALLLYRILLCVQMYCVCDFVRKVRFCAFFVQHIICCILIHYIVNYISLHDCTIFISFFYKGIFLKRNKNKKIIYVPLRRHGRTPVQKFMEKRKGVQGETGIKKTPDKNRAFVL